MAKKANTKKTQKEIDINNIDSMVDDMKKLALEKPKEEKENKGTFPKKPKKEKQEASDTPIEKTAIEETPQIEEVVETSSEIAVEEVVETPKENEEDLSFIDEIKDKNEEKPKETKPKETKKKMTYESMFGPTWCGYGFTE